MSGYHKQTLCALALILSLVMPQAMAACTAGTLDLELVNVDGTDDAAIHPIAKCFSSMTVSVLADCTLAVAANDQNNFVQDLWSTDTYTQVKACPTGAFSEPYANDAAATATTALASLLQTSIYAEGMTVAVAAAPGSVTLTADTETLVYRSTGKSGSTETGGIFNTVGAPDCDTATQCAASDTGCGAGRYSVLIDSQSTYVCALCASGSYSPSGSTICTNSIAGTALPAVGAIDTSTSSACPAGTFATAGSSDCRPCAPGTYQNAGGASSCETCPTNWYSHTYGATGCVRCINGRPEVCTSCSATTVGSAGAFTATMGGATLYGASSDTFNDYSYPALLKTCSPISTLVAFAVDATCAIEIHALAKTTPTDNGKACSDPSNVESGVMAYYTGTATIMTLVPDNVAVSNIVKIVYTTASTVTMSVAAATRTPPTVALPTSLSGVLTVNGGTLLGTTETITCPAGTYLQGGVGTLTCPACDPGYFCANGVSETECPVGSYSTMGEAICTSSDCGTGKDFNPETNVCDCAPGYRASGDGACTICPVNTYSPGGPTSEIVDSCTDCAAPTPYSAEGSDTCSVCPAGEVFGGSVCTRCAAGQEPNSAGTACGACDSGYYNSDNGGVSLFDRCQRCEAGKKTDLGKTTCTECAAGTYSTWTTSTVRAPSGPTECATCPDGGFSLAGASRCTPCAGGFAKNGEGNGCTKCLLGTYRAPYSTTGCTSCSDGTVAKAGSDVCTRCNAGTFATGAAEICTACGPNFYSTDLGSTACIACPAGTSTLGESGATECSRCPAGTRLVGDTCVDCPAGEFQNRAGQRTCKKCPIGKFSDEEGSTTCEFCPAGKYSGPGAPTCRVCPGGTYSSSAGKGSCSICARGRYSAPGATACTVCSAGYYADRLGSRTCTACPAGSRCPGRGSIRATLCAAGSFQSKPAQTTCTPCPKKTFSNKAGASKCATCASATSIGSKTCNARRRMLLGRFDTATL